jgi:glycosyltransferase involved in cell wall biosynthesis
VGGTIGSAPDRTDEGEVLVLVAARDEGERIGETLAGLGVAFPGATIWVADDGSSDGTGELAREQGARVARAEGIGKGRAMTMLALLALGEYGPGQDRDPVVVLCDGDLGVSAVRLAPLAAAVARGEGELAVAAFARSAGGGFGLALGFARWAVRRRCGLRTRAPISGQRALTLGALRDVLPFADGYGMEIGMTIDAARAGHRLVELELDLEHRATGRDLGGFLHRGRQLADFARVYFARR